jgi:hypothetical protein
MTDGFEVEPGALAEYSKELEHLTAELDKAGSDAGAAQVADTSFGLLAQPFAAGLTAFAQIVTTGLAAGVGSMAKTADAMASTAESYTDTDDAGADNLSSTDDH